MDKSNLRKRLLAEREALMDREQRAELLQQVMRIWLLGRQDSVIGAYWPIKQEFDPLPALYRWQEDAELVRHLRPNTPKRSIGLPVIDREHKTLQFHAWFPGCPMQEDAYDILKPKDTPVISPTLLFVPCLGFGEGGYRLGYGGGFYDRTLAQLSPKPFSVGLAFASSYVPGLAGEPHDVPLDAVLCDTGVVWER